MHRVNNPICSLYALLILLQWISSLAFNHVANYLRYFGLAASYPTLNELPLKSLPSSPAIAARAYII